MVVFSTDGDDEEVSSLMVGGHSRGGRSRSPSPSPRSRMAILLHNKHLFLV